MNDVSHAQQTFSTSCVWWWRWRRPWRRSVRLTKLQEVQVSGGVAQTCMTHVSWSGVAQLEWPTILSDGRMNRYKDGHLSQVTMEVLHMANHTGALPGSSWGWWHHRRSGPSFSERLRRTSLHAEHLFTSSPCISIGLYWDLIQFFPLKLRNLHHDFRSFSSPPPPEGTLYPSLPITPQPCQCGQSQPNFSLWKFACSGLFMWVDHGVWGPRCPASSFSIMFSVRPRRTVIDLSSFPCPY